MCGRFNIIDSPEVQFLMETLGITTGLSHREDCPPGGPISIIIEEDGERKVVEATWWLLLDKESLKPNYKYSSFNTRSDRLHDKKSLGFSPYRNSRCIVPASAIIEGLGDKKSYFKVELENSAMALGGIYRKWLNKDTGEFKYSASIITLPPLLPEWQHIHPKSFPLMLPYKDSELIQQWLNPEQGEVKQFEELLEPQVTTRQIITKVEKPSTWLPVEDPFFIVPSEVSKAS